MLKSYILVDSLEELMGTIFPVFHVDSIIKFELCPVLTVKIKIN